MAELFGRERTVIGRHIRNVFVDGEPVRESNVRNLHIANSDKPVSVAADRKLTQVLNCSCSIYEQENTG